MPVFAFLTRIIYEASTAEADPGMSTSLRFLRLLDVLLSTPAGPSVALAELRQMRLVSMPVCAASLRYFMNNAGSLHQANRRLWRRNSKKICRRSARSCWTQPQSYEWAITSAVRAAAGFIQKSAKAVCE
jgi:hypothetical protein